MAAIIEPRRAPALPPQRPALRLVATNGRTVEAPMDLGLGIGPAHVVAAVVGLVLVLVLSLAIGNGALAGLAPAPAGSSGAAATTGSSTGTGTVEVHAGDTFWSIARRMQPTGDVRPLVDELIELNGTANLQPGQQIVVPA